MRKSYLVDGTVDPLLTGVHLMVLPAGPEDVSTLTLSFLALKLTECAQGAPHATATGFLYRSPVTVVSCKEGIVFVSKPTQSIILNAINYQKNFVKC